MGRDHPHDFVFYSPDLHRDAQRVDLTGEEHHHLDRVLRMTTGETIFVTNGRGIISRCLIDRVDEQATRLRVAETVEDRRDDEPLVLALACLKKEAYELAVKQCSELGVTRFLPFVAAKSHVTSFSPSLVTRLQRIALSAMKQSFRAVLPEIGEPVSFDTLLDNAASCRSVIVGDADAPGIAPHPRPRPIMIVVGPEGDLTGEERDRLVAVGGELASISTHRLRAETAAAVLTALVASPDGGAR